MKLAPPRSVKLAKVDEARIKKLAKQMGISISDALRFCVSSGLPLIEANGIQPNSQDSSK